MSIERISKTEDLRNHFQSCSASGLIDFTNPGYERWHWKYAETPFFLGQELSAWLCTLDSKIVGHLGAIPVKLKVGARKIDAAWAVDFKTLSEYRKKGIGMSLVKEANQHFDAFLAIGGTNMSSRLFAKMGWVYLGNVPHYIRILDPDTLFESKVKKIFIAAFIKIYNYLKKPIEPRGIEVSIVDNFNEEADLFWREIERFYKIVIPRNKAYLSWKYDMQPWMHYVKFQATHGNQLCGYIIMRAVKTARYHTEGLIVDIIVRPDDKDAVCALIFSALKYLKSENCSIVRCCINNKEIQKVLTRIGFMKRKPQMHF